LPLRQAEREATHGADHVGVGSMAFALGQILFKEGQVDDAGEAFSRALSIRGSIRNGSSLEAGKDQLWLGRVRLEQGRVDEASKLLHRSLELLRRLLPPGHPDLLAAEAEVERARDFTGAPGAGPEEA
ncbi:MAG: tetratricopeptide repeat protein, partial [Acidobacteriota bacterium]